jgi:phosphoglycerate kinase
MEFQSLKNTDVKNKFVLLRADLNVPTKDGAVTDTTRIDRLKPTIDYLVKNGAKTLIVSHFGRPKGVTPEFSLKFMLPALKKSWGVDVAFADDCIGPKAETARASLQPGQILLLENVRFHEGEEKNDPAFTRELARLGDIFVNDAFSAAHRAHSSTTGLADQLPAVAGFLMEAELNALNAALENPQRPVAAIVGGAKVSTKLELLNNLVQKVDVLVLGGGMANTFLYAQGLNVGASLCEKEMEAQARAISETAQAHHCTIILPVDGVAADGFAENSPNDIYSVNALPADRMVLDLGPASIDLIKAALKSCKTVVWNGPLGAFEIAPFDKATMAIAHFVADETKAGHFISVAGGGDTVAALEKASTTDDMTYVSTAGGAFLEWMEGKTLPGVAALCPEKKAA